MATFLQVHLEFFSGLRREYLSQSVTNRIKLVKPQRVTVLKSGSLIVHEYLVFRNRAGHELTIATEDIATIGLDDDAVSLQTVGNLRPILPFSRHDVEGPTYDDKAQHRQEQGNCHITWHDFICVKFAHTALLLSFRIVTLQVLL